MSSVLREFRDFALRGNLVELAVAVIIATALTTLVRSLIDNLIMPVVAAIGGQPDFRDLTFTINDAVFRYGAFITDLITFLILAAVIFFLIVKPFNTLLDRLRRPRASAEDAETTEQILADIRELLRRDDVARR
ncbi:MAG TPA: large conductance mechanosensitive channel protein MscL [Miltoncostaeaceae bacterium]|nr:large conductance mechanosensitive channel protein MscL [Miltoncostaeaceae bacterium]